MMLPPRKIPRMLQFAALVGVHALRNSTAGACVPRFIAPAAPLHATGLNGAQIPDACFNRTGEHHVFIIGDWGGVALQPGTTPVPADRRSPKFPAHSRPFVIGADNCAQQRVALQMSLRAKKLDPDYIINVGDNFYWGGVDAHCGSPPFTHIATHQWRDVFEKTYTGPGLDGKQWLGVLGNHDYGGYMFTSAWDQAIGYTWYRPDGPGSVSRWMTPAQYWRTKVWYPDCSVDYYFLDSNLFVAMDPNLDQSHNLCSIQHNEANASCGAEGPTSLEDCPRWFGQLWVEQMTWLEKHLSASVADWQIVVTHFPPIWGKDDWVYLAAKHGIDIMISGHIHKQELVHLEPESFLKPTAYLISGGGGGITSEGTPSADGLDDQYGFMDLMITKSEIRIEAVSHGGHTRKTAKVQQRFPEPMPAYAVPPKHKDHDATTPHGSVEAVSVGLNSDQPANSTRQIV